MDVILYPYNDYFTSGYQTNKMDESQPVKTTKAYCSCRLQSINEMQSFTKIANNLNSVFVSVGVN